VEKSMIKRIAKVKNLKGFRNAQNVMKDLLRMQEIIS
jgi:hypothetical protein